MDFLKTTKKMSNIFNRDPQVFIGKNKDLLKIVIPFLYLFYKKSTKIKSKKHPRNPSLSVFPLPPPPP